MALRVDSTDLFIESLLEVFGSGRDALALLGAFYLTRKTFNVTWQVYKALKTHFIAKYYSANLVRKYRPWAGTN